jgi:hypothetical protein
VNLYAYAGNNPISYDDPFGLWDPEAHRKILAHALGHIATPRQIAHFIGASDDQDVVHNFDYKRHYLRSKSESPAEGKEKAEAYIAGEIKTAQRLRSEGLEDQAAYHLGNALHTIADGTSPVHVDGNGDPKAYPGPGHSMCDQCLGSERSQDITQSTYFRNDERMRQAYYQVYPEARP